MEKFRFTVRVFSILLAFPVIMFSELSRDDGVNKISTQIPEEKVSQKTSDNSGLVCQFPLLQAVYN